MDDPSSCPMSIFDLIESTAGKKDPGVVAVFGKTLTAGLWRFGPTVRFCNIHFQGLVQCSFRVFGADCFFLPVSFKPQCPFAFGDSVAEEGR